MIVSYAHWPNLRAKTTLQSRNARLTADLIERLNFDNTAKLY
jgi:hypothetical protein